jgi:hypothetical protein
MPRPYYFVPAGLLFLATAALGPSRAEEAVLRITRADCNRLVKHRAAPDAAYRPGVDAHGRAVPPADLGGGARIKLSDTLVIPIEIELAERLGIPADPARFDADALIGVVEVGDGPVTFNGRPLADEGQAALAAKCRAALGNTGTVY